MVAGAALSERWQRYYAAAGEAPRETLLEALARFEEEGQPPGLAVDLGCGAGRDTFELLRRGWRVVAVDAETRAIELLLDHPDVASHHDRLETVVARLAEADWPEAVLVNASFSLPFCPPAEFERTWQRVVDSLAHGGRFCGQLFGERDGWAPADNLTFHSRAQVEELLAGLDVETAGRARAGWAHRRGRREVLAPLPRRRAQAVTVAPARRAAYEVLLRVFEEGAYADRALRTASAALDERDRALARQLTFGAVQRKRTLDHAIETLGKRPVRKLDPPVRAALRLGAYQLGLSRRRAALRGRERVRGARPPRQARARGPLHERRAAPRRARGSPGCSTRCPRGR